MSHSRVVNGEKGELCVLDLALQRCRFKREIPTHNEQQLLIPHFYKGPYDIQKSVGLEMGPNPHPILHIYLLVIILSNPLTL